MKVKFYKKKITLNEITIKVNSKMTITAARLTSGLFDCIKNTIISKKTDFQKEYLNKIKSRFV